MRRKYAKLLTRLLLIAAAVIVFAAGGAALGLLAARGAEPLVGGAMVALGAIAGGAAGLLAGAVAAWKLPARGRRVATRVLGGPALLLLALGIAVAWRLDQQARDPEAAYAGLPMFVAVLERDPAQDPYLATRVEVNAGTRRWTTQLPDGRRCSGRLRAAVQRRVGAALPAGPLPAACRDGPPAGAQERITWELAGGASGAALTDAACRAAAPRLAALARVLSMASSLADSGASCD